MFRPTADALSVNKLPKLSGLTFIIDKVKLTGVPTGYRCAQILIALNAWCGQVGSGETSSILPISQVRAV